LSINK